MNTARTVLPVLIGLAFVVVLLGLAWRSQRALERGLPPRDALATSQAEGYERARAFALASGGDVVGVLGTGSMAPYIPEGRGQTAEVRQNEIVAYAVTRRGATFDDVRPGAVCLYAHAASPEGMTLHGAAKYTREGWIMSGLNNARSDVWMTPANFRGIVARVFVWRVEP